MLQAIAKEKTAAKEPAIQNSPIDTAVMSSKATGLTARKTKAKAKAFAASLIPPPPKKDLRPYYDTFLALLMPMPEGILAEVLPKIVNDKKLGPYFKDILIELGCENEKIIIDTSVQWLNTTPEKAGTLALVNKWPNDESGLKADVIKFTNHNATDKTQMENKFKEVLIDIGCNVYDKLWSTAKGN